MMRKHFLSETKQLLCVASVSYVIVGAPSVLSVRKQGIELLASFEWRSGRHTDLQFLDTIARKPNSISGPLAGC